MKIALISRGYVFDICVRTQRLHPEPNMCGVFAMDMASP